MLHNALDWFEIPTTDLARATRFYEAVLQVQLIPLDLGELKMAMIPVKENTVGGALCHNPEFYKPSATHGPVIYLNGNPDLQVFLDRVSANGGQVLMPKTLISPENGYMAIFLDVEGNRMAFHSMQ